MRLEFHTQEGVGGVGVNGAESTASDSESLQGPLPLKELLSERMQELD